MEQMLRSPTLLIFTWVFVGGFVESITLPTIKTNSDSTLATKMYSVNDDDDFNCTMKPTNQSKNFFRHSVYYKNLNFVYLSIQPGEGVSLQGGKHVISESTWTWTFYGDEGALEFLNWPTEFGIWSMGLLNNFVAELPITLLNVSGNCSNLLIGNVTVNTAISEALVQLVTELIDISTEDSEKYGPSFFCYKERMFIHPRSLYVFCKHILCPFGPVQYRCCSYFFVQEEGHRKIRCYDRFQFHYDNLWWTGPIAFSIVLFAFVPLLLMKMAHFLCVPCQQVGKCVPTSVNGEKPITFVFYDGKPQITLIRTTGSPFFAAYTWLQFHCPRILRLVWPFFSLSLIGIQIYLDNEYLQKFVLDSIAKGTPMGFRSMLAGYSKSKYNFLPYLGGPYVAIGMYIVIGSIFLVLPDSLSSHLEIGIPDTQSHTFCTPLAISLKCKARLCSIDIQAKNGFQKVFSLCLAHFFMIFDRSYWSLAIHIQIKRLRTTLRSKVCFLLLPLYVVLCIFEHILCILLYGLPVIFFSQILFRSYYILVLRTSHSRRWESYTLFGSCMILLVTGLTLLLFMVLTIFLDACLFLTRLFMFTFTGVVIYPKASYGYLIFTMTSVYYLVDCVGEYSQIYTRILKATIKVCKKLQRVSDDKQIVIKRGLFHGVKKVILDHVIDRLQPKRKRAFLSLLKLSLVLGAIGVSLALLEKTDKFRELNILIHVSTTLFMCAAPKLTRKILGKRRDGLARRKLEEQVKKVVRDIVMKSCPVEYMSAESESSQIEDL